MKPTAVPAVTAAVAAAALLIPPFPAFAAETETVPAGPPAAPEVVAAPDPDKKPAPVPKVQLALLLDTSSSMDGLINQARAQLWTIVNEFIGAKRHGQAPQVEVALYEYGNNGLKPEENWIRCVLPLTRDLDDVSRRLFELTTNGGDEYCGAVIRHAESNLAWSDEPGVYKAIFVAGNEAFTQGPADAVEACRAAVAKGITVNTILCGNEGGEIAAGWRSGAVVADGRFLTIDQNQSVASVPAPQDAELVRLSGELNKTYIGYGAHASEMSANQIAQDSNAAGLAPAAAVSRASTKASANYSNASWDLVDAIAEKTVDLATLDRDQLPEELRKLDEAGLKKHIDTQAAARREIQEKIRTLNAERDEFLAKSAAPADNSLKAAVVEAVREQAVKLDFRWEKN